MELDDLLVETKKRNMDNVVNAVCYHTKTSKTRVLSKSRERHYVDCRRLVFTLIREIYNYPLLTIGRHFGKNHATIIHQLKVHKQLCGYSNEYSKSYNTIKHLLVVDQDSFTVSKILVEEREYYQKMLNNVNDQIIAQNEED